MTGAAADLASGSSANAARRGLVDRAFAWLERLPGTAIPWIFVGVAALTLVAHAASWLSGEAPLGELRPELLFPIPFLTFFLLFIVVLDGVAHSSFDDFRSSLDQPAERVERLRADLTSIPDLAALVTGLALVVTFTIVGSDPSNQDVEPPATGVALNVLWFITNFCLGLVVVHTLRQLRQVGRLLAMDARVNLLDPGPINAFSRLTAATAGAILTIGVLFAIGDTADPSSAGLGAEVLIAGIAVLFFVLPLRGMHGRLATEKGRLLGETNSRLRTVIDRIHRMVDTDDLERADELQKTEAALLAERDLYLHLSTWPWTTGVFRGLSSAVMLPILIGIVLRLLSHVI